MRANGLRFLFFLMAQTVLPQLMDLFPGMKGGRTGLFRGVRRLQAGVVLLMFGKLGFCFISDASGNRFHCFRYLLNRLFLLLANVGLF